MSVFLLKFDVQLQKSRKHGWIVNTRFKVLDVRFPVQQIFLANLGQVQPFYVWLLQSFFCGGLRKSAKINWHPKAVFHIYLPFLQIVAVLAQSRLGISVVNTLLIFRLLVEHIT